MKKSVYITTTNIQTGILEDISMLMMLIDLEIYLTQLVYDSCHCHYYYYYYYYVEKQTG